MIATHKLLHAVVLAEHRNFRRAAENLNLTQPALTRSIQSLERALDVRLFDRSHGSVGLTAFGELVVRRAQEILLDISELEQEIDLIRGIDRGTLDVSLGPYPSALSGQRAVAKFLTGHPEIHCRVRVASFSNVAEDVGRGHSDIGIADLEPAAALGLATEKLVQRPMYFVARRGHPLLKRPHCSLSDLLDFPWAAIRFPARAGRRLPRDVGRAGYWDRASGEFVPALEVDQVSTILDLAGDSDILAATTLTMLEDKLHSGKLSVVPFAESWLGLNYGFIARPNRTLSPAALGFMNVVREIEAELSERELLLRDEYL